MLSFISRILSRNRNRYINEFLDQFLSPPPPSEHITDHLLHFHAGLLGADYAKLFISDGQKLTLCGVYDVRHDKRLTMNRLILPIADFADQPGPVFSSSAHVAATRKPLVIPNYREYTSRRPLIDLYSTKGERVTQEVVLPIVLKDQLVYVLCFDSVTRGSLACCEGDSTSLSERIAQYMGVQAAAYLASIDEVHRQALEQCYHSITEMGELETRSSVDSLVQKVLACPDIRSIRVHLCGLLDGDVLLDYVKRDRTQSRNPAIAAPAVRMALHDTETTSQLVLFGSTVGLLSVSLMDDMPEYWKTETCARIAKMLSDALEAFVYAAVRRVMDGLRQLPVSLRDTVKRSELRKTRKAIHDVLGYKAMHLWVVDEGGLTATLSEDSSIRVAFDENTLVSSVWREKKERLRYDVTPSSPRVKFKDLVPAGNRSWCGIPIIHHGEVVGILSCFDKSHATDPLLNILDMEILRAAALLLGIEIDYDKAKDEYLRTPQFHSHQVVKHLGNVLINMRQIKRLVPVERSSDAEEYHRPLTTRPLWLLVRNVDAFIGLAVRSMRLTTYDNIKPEELTPTRCDLHQLVAETVAMVRALLASEERTCTISFNVFKRVVVVDRFAVQEALVNLLLNAAKYGAPHAAIRVYNTDAGLCVSNLGIGVPPEDVDRIFNQFVQGSNSSLVEPLECDAVGGHKGLGLFLARKLLRAAGCDITLVSPGYCHTSEDLSAIVDDKTPDELRTVFAIAIKGGQ